MRRLRSVVPASLLLRRAARVAARSPWRTAWSGALVALPVAAGVVLLAVAWGHSVEDVSPGRAFGRADAIYRSDGIEHSGVVAVEGAASAVLPVGSRVAAIETVDGLTVLSDRDGSGVDGASGGEDRSGSGGISARMADWDDPLLDGMVRMVDGRPPGPGEVVLSPELSESIGQGVGTTVRLLDTDATLDVVGIGTTGEPWVGMLLDAGELTPVPGADPWSSVAVAVEVPAGTELPSAAVIGAAAGLPADRGVIGPIRRDPDAHGSGADPAPEPSTAAIGRSTAALAGLLGGTVVVVGLLAAAAAGIGARRRLRANGLLAANGAGRRHLAFAAASEAAVVAAPAALVGIAAAMLIPGMWIRFRLPGWVPLTESVMPWPWAALCGVAAVVAASVGAVAFSHSMRALPTSALLDARSRIADVAGRRRHSSLVLLLGVGLLAYLIGGSALWLVGARVATFGGLAGIAIVLMWGCCAFGALRLLGVVLDRDPVGRLVERDLRRHRVGSTATVLVVATWVFVAVGGTATDRFASQVTPDGAASSVTSGPPSPGPTTTPSPGGGVDPAASNPGSAGSDAEADAGVGGVGVVLAARPAGAASTTGWMQRGGSTAPEGGIGAASPDVPDEVRSRLSKAGLSASPALLGSYTGPCDVCPSGFEPTVLVLEHADGLGLPPATVDLLRSGVAVTPFEVAEMERQSVAGVGVRVGSVPSGVDAVVLASAVTDGSPLADRRPALVADTGGLDAAQVDRVIRVIRDEGLWVASWDPRLDPMRWEPIEGWTNLPGSGHGAWWWLVVLVSVTLLATAAHRREHGEVGRVLWVLGAGPRSARRLSALTALSLSGVGVAMGLTAVVAVVVLEAGRHRGGDPFHGLWNGEASALVVAALTVPFVVGLLARMLPVSSAGRDVEDPMPA